VLATAANEIHAAAAVPDQDGWLHVFWVEADSPTINYVRWDGQRWSRSLPVLTSPSGEVEQPATLLTGDRRLLVMWKDEQSGRFYYSQTRADDAAFTEEWITPQELPLQHEGVTSADILVDGTNTIYVVFAVPVNEGRGIYLIRSEDHGDTWSEPTVVFDAVGELWAMVDEPQLIAAANGDLHLLWKRYAPPPNGRPQALAYARSSDGGASWSPWQSVAQSEILWSGIINAGNSSIHRYWQEMADGKAVLRQQTSEDNGLSWSFTSIAGDASETSPLDLAADAAGHLHLINSEDSRLNYQLWDGERWSQAESLALSQTDLSTVSTLAAAVTSDSSLAVVLAGRVEEREEEAAVSENTSGDESSEALAEHAFALQFARQPVVLPVAAQQPPASDSAPATAIVTPEAEEVAVAVPSPEPAAATEAAPLENSVPPEGGVNSGLANLSLQTIVVLALLPAGLLVLLVLALSVYRARKTG
jgi:hypothetical protein